MRVIGILPPATSARRGRRAQRHAVAAVLAVALAIPCASPLAQTPPPVPAKKWPHPAEQTRRSLQERMDEEVPHFQVSWAYDHYVGRRGIDRDEEEARQSLLLFVIRASDRGLRANRAHIVAAGWRRSFLAEFDRAAAFVAELKAGDPHHIFELSLRFKSMPGDTNRSLADATNLLASSLGSQAADLDSAIDDLENPRFGSRPDALGLYLLAEDGYAPAIAELIARHRTGRVLPRDDARAYFWALVGGEWGLDTAADIEALEPMLTAEQIAWAREHFRTGRRLLAPEL